MKTVFLTFFVSMLATYPVAAAEDVFMTGEELKALFAADKTINLGGPEEGYTGTLMIKADGSGVGTAKTSGGKVIVLEGTWYVKKDNFCRKWKDLDKGKEVCEAWKKIGDNRVEVQVKKKKVGVNWW